MKWSVEISPFPFTIEGIEARTELEAREKAVDAVLDNPDLFLNLDESNNAIFSAWQQDKEEK
ncbi:MAG: hypothetical protein LBQ63_02545 [Deltaproteobacteria bacterium]|jgi:hypothetical protein|nr:hypothetical protein [Deltaproteobacteria bacterium]